MYSHLIKLWSYLDKPKKKKFFFLVGLMIASALVEIFSIGAVIPFIVALTSPSKVFNNPNLNNIFLNLGYVDPAQIVFPITLIFILAAVSASIIRVSLLWLNNKYIFDIGKDLGYRLYSKILHQSYEVQVQRNSSDVINILSSKINSVVYSSIMTSINFISSTIMLIFILVGLLLIDFRIIIFSIIFFGLIYLTIIRVSKKYLLENSLLVSASSSRLVKIIQEGLGGIRDIIIDQTQETFCRDYKAHDSLLRSAQLKNVFISNSPRFFVEGMGAIGIALAAYFLTINEGSGSSIAMLAILGIGAQKLLPLVQQAYSANAEFKANQRSLQDILDLLAEPSDQISNSKSLNFQLKFSSSIQFESISFAYPGCLVPVLNDLNLVISKGERVGIIGETGSGKSTFMDVLMGLLYIQGGKIIIDDTEITKDEMPLWRKHLAHVPQFIYLTDSSIAENIAFGRPASDINMELVRKVARKAKLCEVIERMPKKYDTIIGERGVKLSGGQRQRIGIARALYKQADLIVLDEATSALDEVTELALMENIYELDQNLTLIIVAHRLSTLRGCNRILKIQDGKLYEVNL